MSNFIIRQNATMPVLTMELIQDGINGYQNFYDKLENATITFFMEEVGSCIPYLQCRTCCLLIVKECNDCPDKPYIQYKWTANDTRKKGNFRGRFEILFQDTNDLLIVPIKEDLIINII